MGAWSHTAKAAQLSPKHTTRLPLSLVAFAPRAAALAAARAALAAVAPCTAGTQTNAATHAAANTATTTRATKAGMFTSTAGVLKYGRGVG